MKNFKDEVDRLVGEYINELEEEKKEKIWLGCERLLCIMGLMLGILGLCICFMAIFILVY